MAVAVSLLFSVEVLDQDQERPKWASKGGKTIIRSLFRESGKTHHWCSIYKEIGPGERIALCKLAVHQLEQTGQPLRLAIDFSIWQFQVQAAKGASFFCPLIPPSSPQAP